MIDGFLLVFSFAWCQFNNSDEEVTMIEDVSYW